VHFPITIPSYTNVALMFLCLSVAPFKTFFFVDHIPIPDQFRIPSSHSGAPPVRS